MVYISQTINPRVFEEGEQNASSRTQGHTFWHRSGKRLGVIHFPEKESEYGFTWEGPKLAELTFPDLSQVLSTGYLGNFPATPNIQPATTPGTTLALAIDLETNPRACCGTLTHTLPVECAGNNNSTLGNDVFYTFTLEKHCDLWPTLQINTNNSDFDVVTKVEFWGINNAWNNLNQNSTNIWNWDNGDFLFEDNFPAGFTANFRIQIDANSTTATGSFKLEIAAIKQSNADPQVCADDFNSCCRIAVDTAEYDPELLATAVIPAFDFTLIPNPANEHVTIKFNNTLDEFAIIELLDGFGKTKSTSKAKGSAANLNLSNLPSGLYAVRVLSKGKYVTKKLVLVK